MLDAAGGLERFNQIEGLEIVADVTGALWTMKGHQSRSLMTVYMDTKQPRVVIYNLGAQLDDPHLRWIWTPEYLSVERPDGTVVLSRKDPAQRMKEQSITTQWDDLDLLYFRGYASWNYFMTPFYFTWPGFSTREVEKYKDNDETWRVLEVTYPADFPTHHRVQKFFYDDKYQMRRLDYSVDVIPGSGEIAHMVYDQKKIDGIFFPTLRRALQIVDGQPSGSSRVLLNFHKISVKGAEVKASL